LRPRSGRLAAGLCEAVQRHDAPHQARLTRAADHPWRWCKGRGSRRLPAGRAHRTDRRRSPGRRSARSRAPTGADTENALRCHRGCTCCGGPHRRKACRHRVRTLSRIDASFRCSIHSRTLRRHFLVPSVCAAAFDDRNTRSAARIDRHMPGLFGGLDHAINDQRGRPSPVAQARKQHRPPRLAARSPAG